MRMALHPWLHRPALIILPTLGYLLLRVLYWSNRVRYQLPERLPSEPVIVAFWHGEMLMQPYLYLKLRPKPRRIAVIIGTHKDGEYIARLLGHFGFDTVRGSSNRHPARALLGALRKMQRGFDIAITPDGPRGPRHSVADGVVTLAFKSNCHIVPFTVKADRCWRLQSWDRFFIPRPFGTITLSAGEPFRVDHLSLEQAKALVADKLGQSGGNPD
jgi:Kdo2-lipid IVA 3' secondary acyltransferase